MALSTEEKKKRALEKQIASRERQIARQRAKQSDPKWRAEQVAKKMESARRQAERRKEKVNSAEYQEKQRAKAAAAEKRRREALATSKPAKPAKPIKSKGLKGRAPTAQERAIMNALCQLPCIACYNQGRHNPVISYHHVDGRTKPLAHARGLPLCAHHHDTPADKDTVSRYPDLIPVHAKGALGGKAAWEKIHGTQFALIAQCYELAGISMPDGLFLD